MADFYTTFVKGLPRDEWGHPVLPKPEKLKRREYETRLTTLQIELAKMQQWTRTHGERVLMLFEGRLIVHASTKRGDAQLAQPVPDRSRGFPSRTVLAHR
jgi:Polyphosphate kinase 2 (PPK2)